MKIEAGKLDRRLTILAPSKAQDSLGQVVLGAATTIATTYAQRLELRTQDSARAGQRDTFAVSRFRIRYRPGVTTDMRVMVDGKLYDILAIDEPDRRKTLVLTVEEAE